MTSEGLVLAVARAMFVAEHGSDEDYAEYQGYYIAQARVAIGVVIKEASSCAHDAWFDVVPIAEIHKAIRALAQPQDGEGK